MAFTLGWLARLIGRHQGLRERLSIVVWIFLPIGVFSVVSKQPAAADELLVRSRVREDLLALRRAGLETSKVLTSAVTDYPFRVVVKRDALAAFVGRFLLEGLKYDNFKNAVASKQGHARADVYHDVWSVLFQAFSWARPSQTPSKTARDRFADGSSMTYPKPVRPVQQRRKVTTNKGTV
jgi:hypothetical protein